MHLLHIARTFITDRDIRSRSRNALCKREHVDGFVHSGVTDLDRKFREDA
ncbi:hypothetical protein [Burkholderia territorii]|nr:hypothetical protein [Burkholderia territorii]